MLFSFHIFSPPPRVWPKKFFKMLLKPWTQQMSYKNIRGCLFMEHFVTFEIHIIYQK